MSCLQSGPPPPHVWGTPLMTTCVCSHVKGVEMNREGLWMGSRLPMDLGIFGGSTRTGDPEENTGGTLRCWGGCSGGEGVS